MAPVVLVGATPAPIEGVPFPPQAFSKSEPISRSNAGNRHRVVKDIYNKPNSRARATASVRLWTCSLLKIIRLCPLTVLKARKSR